MEWGTERGASSVIGVVLLVAVVVVVGTVVALGALTFLEGLGAPTATADFSYDRTSAGLVMTPEAISTAVTVRLNGRDVATIDPDSAGQSVLLPTAPGDRITVVSRDGDQSVLVQRTVDGRSQIGDFIAYYTFEEGDDPDVLEDQSGNGNDAELQSSNTDSWTGNAYEFDGENDYFKLEGLNTPVSEVSEFTIAVAYKTNTGTEKQELVEHIRNEDNWGMELKTGSNGGTYEPVFFVDDASGSQTGQIFADPQPKNERQVLVGTHDGNSGESELYVDGARVEDDRTFRSNTTMGDFYIGRDAESSRDYLDGEIYEIRLYYTAFDNQEVRTITNAME